MSAKPWMRLTGAGLELAGTTILIGSIGFVIDRRAGNVRPIATALLALAGFAIGMYRFVRIALSVSQTQRDAERSRIEARRRQDSNQTAKANGPEFGDRSPHDREVGG